ncbi:MAG: toprim domain-containing protein, partial [Lewinellaceae bacterium]|nr:toprim domain-containing protein [Lewinellaceae bacterium]
ENVVASSGTSLTTEQIRLIKRFTNNIKILFDGDAAGIRAALRGLGMTLEEDLNVRLVVLPPGEDPDSYIQKVGVAAFQEYLKSESKDLIQFETELLLQEAGKDPTRRAAVLGEIAKTIAKVKNPLKRDEYVKICRETLQVDEGALVLEINRHLRRELDKLDQQTQVEGNRGIGEEPLPDINIPGPAAVTGDEFQEKDITRLLITSGAEWYDVAEELTVAEFIIHNIEDVLEEFDHPLYQRVILECRDRLDAHQPISQGYFTSHADDAIRQLAVGFLTSPYEYSENWANKWDIHLNQKHPEQNYHQDAENLLKRFKFRKLTRLIKRNQEKIKELAASHSPELMAHLQLHQRLKDIHTDLAKDLGTVVF